MGGEPYWYIVKYQADAEAALQQLRMREFKAGRYNPVIPFIDFPITEQSPAPGAQHETIDDVFEEAAEDGTRSILDIQQVGSEPDFGVAVPLGDYELEEIYGTSQPTKKMVLGYNGFLENIERGHGIYFTIYKDGKPDEILFAGYSFD